MYTHTHSHTQRIDEVEENVVYVFRAHLHLVIFCEIIYICELFFLYINERANFRFKCLIIKHYKFKGILSNIKKETIFLSTTVVDVVCRLFFDCGPLFFIFLDYFIEYLVFVCLFDMESERNA